MQHAAFDRLIVCIAEDDVRALATQFKVNFLQGVRRRLRNQGPRAGGAGKTDHINLFMRGQLATNADPVTVYQVKDTFGKAGLVHQLGKDHGIERAFLGWLQHHRAPCYHCRTDLEGDLVHWPVPRRDKASHTHSLADDTVVGGMVAQGLFKLEFFRSLDEIAQMPGPCTNL